MKNRAVPSEEGAKVIDVKSQTPTPPPPQPPQFRMVSGLSADQKHVVVMVVERVSEGEKVIDAEFLKKSPFLLNARMKWALHRIFKRNAKMTAFRDQSPKFTKNLTWKN